jgi:DNA-binding PadR family transcriptional regulator
MKYNININQLVLSKTDLDLVDCAILDYLYFYCNSVNEKINEQRITNEQGIFTWVTYQTLLEDMPLLKIKSSSALTPRIKKIEKAGFITTHREEHRRLFIKMNDKVDELFTKTNRAIHENEQLLSKSYSRTRTYNNTIYNNTIDKEASNDLFDAFWKEYPRKIAKVSAEKSFNKLKPTAKLLEEILKGLKKWCDTEQWQERNGQYIPHPATFLNQRRWEDEIETTTINVPDYTKEWEIK